MRTRVGVFGTTNAVIGVVFFGAFSALVAFTILSIASGTNVVWSSIGGAIALVAALWMALLAASGFSTWRAVEVKTDATGNALLSVPGFTARRGFYRDVVAVGDVNDVRLAFRSEPRNSRWQLVVTRRGGPPLYSDSITCGRGSNADVSNTRAGRAVQHLREQVGITR